MEFDDEENSEEEFEDITFDDENSAFMFCVKLKEEGEQLVEEGEYNRGANKFQQVLHHLRDFLAHGNSNRLLHLAIETLLHIAGCSVETNNVAGALICAQQAREVLERDRDGRDDLYVLALFRQGQALLRQGKTLTAMEAFIAALDISPDNEQVRSEIRRLEEEMGMNEKSQKGIEGLLRKLKEKESEAKLRSEAEQLRKKSLLLHSGAFGGRLKSENSLFILQRRERGGKNRMSDLVNITSRFLPTGVPTTVAQYEQRAYSGQYNHDGSFFYTTCQDFRVRIYDTSLGTFKLVKSVQALQGRWTLTDAVMSRDNQFLIYSSITPFVHLWKVNLDSSERETEVNQELLDFSSLTSSNFGLWSIRFSSDNREIIGGASDGGVYVFNVERKDVVKYEGHLSEVNAVSFAREEDSNILFTGSDDSSILIWDRRSLRSKGKPSGMLIGHTEGLTYISSKGDGRYLISNAKDQTMKLWDIRTMTGDIDYGKVKRGYRYWDYRGMDYPGDPRMDRHPSDMSVQTFIGHRVLRTLIRCHFSPGLSTGHRYVYTGSQDGVVRIYDMGGNVVRELSSPLSSVVRDASWHPRGLGMTVTSWDGTISHFNLDR